MMAVNQQSLEGNWHEIKGKLRDRWGQLSGDELESVHGNIEQLVGTIQRRTGEAREQVEQYLEKLTNRGASMVGQAAEGIREYAHTAQGAVQDAARQATEAAREGFRKTEMAVQQKPLESLAVCFGVGVITGVVVGLMLRSR
jgi:uncharacterized protein YjbJ (UPF0337 family)